jgi:cytochrome c oxidase subunit IV
MYAGRHSVRINLYVFIVLCILTVISFTIGLIASQDNKLLVWVLMAIISCAKAGLVISIFMHLRWEKWWKWFLTVPATAMGLLLTIALVPDIGNRNVDLDDAGFNDLGHAPMQTKNPNHYSY